MPEVEKKQPLLEIVLESGTVELVNERQVCRVRKHPKGYAILIMPNGEELVVVKPAFDEWHLDVVSRKF